VPSVPAGQAQGTPLKWSAPAATTWRSRDVARRESMRPSGQVVFAWKVPAMFVGTSHGGLLARVLSK